MALPFFVSRSTSKSSFKNKTLILPLPTISSLPQLSTDLLLHSPTLSFVLTGFLDPTLSVPAVGPLDHLPPGPGAQSGHASQRKEGITMPAEVWVDESKGWVVLQQRAPILKAKKDEFIDRLLSWIAAEGFSSVLVLASVGDEGRVDADIQNPSPLRHFLLPTTTASTALTPHLQKLTPYHTSSTSSSSQEGGKPPAFPYFPSSGLLRRFLLRLSSATTPSPVQAPVETLLIYASEGDNREKVLLLRSQVLTVLGVQEPDKVHVSEPVGWKGLWGSEGDRGIWG
ncbi:hypothetical protein BT69DRAFT_1317247 [Atractiella rhizophila]|nr:hypothetical protein BT69DRAFT_1317247 [Atractiella rhizophila]